MVGLGVLLAAGIGCGGGAGTCHNDNPPLADMFFEGGSSCTLPNGRPGLGDGQYGCIDPTLCHYRAEAGPATYAPGPVCVYAACNGANPGAACALPGGGQGICCNGACSTVDVQTDPSNCGGCGNVCPDGVPCNSGACGIPSSTPACPPGLILWAATCMHSSSCIACVAPSCTGLPDGAPCVVQADAGELMFLDGGFLSSSEQPAGICCHGACAAWYSDNQNCGGCGVTCCPGTNCTLDGPAGIRGFVGIGGWCI